MRCHSTTPGVRPLEALRAVALATIVVAGEGCNFKNPFDFDIGGGGVVAIQIRGDTVVSVGDTVRLLAAGDVDGVIGMFFYDPLPDVRWSISDASMATLTPGPPTPEEIPASYATVKGLREGIVTITVTARDLRAQHAIRIRAEAP